MTAPNSPSYQVLLEAARACGVEPTDIPAVLNESRQSVNNWRVRGVSDAGKIKAHLAFHVPFRMFDPELAAELTVMPVPDGAYPEVEAPSWPMPLLDQNRYERLSEEEKAFVQGAASQAMRSVKTY
ncbi:MULTISPECIES: hypothetical protein [Achromobacter]|uniref:hypothetical protein n=1 Tax=Achromobacter TaxID=222 RepID=UPI0023F6BB90|nr:hypothetical protein [Achromobacter anxifer]MDF8365110.1 hypothetical protein [Achromobacter anxifer]